MDQNDIRTLQRATNTMIDQLTIAAKRTMKERETIRKREALLTRGARQIHDKEKYLYAQMHGKKAADLRFAARPKSASSLSPLMEEKEMRNMAALANSRAQIHQRLATMATPVAQGIMTSAQRLRAHALAKKMATLDRDLSKIDRDGNPEKRRRDPKHSPYRPTPSHTEYFEEAEHGLQRYLPTNIATQEARQVALDMAGVPDPSGLGLMQGTKLRTQTSPELLARRMVADRIRGLEDKLVQAVVADDEGKREEILTEILELNRDTPTREGIILQQRLTNLRAAKTPKSDTSKSDDELLAEEGISPIGQTSPASLFVRRSRSLSPDVDRETKSSPHSSVPRSKGKPKTRKRGAPAKGQATRKRKTPSPGSGAYKEESLGSLTSSPPPYVPVPQTQAQLDALIAQAEFDALQAEFMLQQPLPSFGTPSPVTPREREAFEKELEAFSLSKGGRKRRRTRKKRYRRRKRRVRTNKKLRKRLRYKTRKRGRRRRR